MSSEVGRTTHAINERGVVNVGARGAHACPNSRDGFILRPSIDADGLLKPNSRRLSVKLHIERPEVSDDH